eukprot:TRINITY_DN691_c1_g1_i1.p1 TRINITY_DN691_c1_g1~~TRINITY_DN691_c1_g1_i1.p1  ORF type:complete len:411 (+),score=82.96 TRINITY_DN691_c1_g1_i1:210-1442(+)
MSLLNGLASGAVRAEDGNLVQVSEGQQMANEFMSQQQQQPKWSDQFAQENNIGSSFADDFLQQERRTWGDQFMQEGEVTEEEWMKKWEEQQQRDGNGWSDEYLNTNWEDGMWSEYEKLFMGYQFQENNPYLGNSSAMSIGIQLFNEGNLPEAILALEAAVQADKTNSSAWMKLGQAQAENDQDKQAISALEQAVALDHTNTEALISLAVSHTNECQVEKTSETLIQWLSQNPSYKDLSERPIPHGKSISQHVIELFVEAAMRSSTIDPNVHVSLGLLYNSTWEYDKALECFKAALTVQPDDYALWNKFGATLANSLHGTKHADVAIDAYWRALEKKPQYTRARSNLGISYMATSNYVEAAKCFLGALSINNQSDHLWDLLRSSLKLMQRPDLAERCDTRTVESFRSEFIF